MAKEVGEEESNDEEAWEGWREESESSDDSSDSGGWVDVESDGEGHLSISDGDGDGEDEENRGKVPENVGSTTGTNQTSTLATSKVCHARLLTNG